MSIKEFLPTLIWGPWKALIACGPRSFFDKARPEALSSPAGRRIWLFHLGIAWLAGLPLLLFLAILAHFSSYLGWWTFLWAPARAEEPMAWVFWLGDARPGPLGLCLTLGFLPAILTRRSGWAWVLAALGLFPGIFSIAGAWMLVVGERLAIWIREILAERSPALRRDLIWRTTIAFAMALFLVVSGAGLRDWVQYCFAQAPFDPEWRFLRWGIGLALATALETALALGFFHFYFIFLSFDQDPDLLGNSETESREFSNLVECRTTIFKRKFKNSKSS